MQADIIDYIPAQYKYRFPAMEFLIGIWLLFFAGVGVSIASRASDAIVILCLVFFPCLFIGTIGYTCCYFLMGTWECRVEGDLLSFRCPSGRGWVEVHLNELEAVNTVSYPNEEHFTEYELALRSGARLMTPVLTIGRFHHFKNAVLWSNPAVQFGKRNGSVCYCCGADLRTRRDRCPRCGKSVPGGDIG